MTVEEIFLTAVEKAPAERAMYLDAACGGDAGIRAQVEALLRSHELAGSLLEQPLFRTAPGGDDTRTGPSAADGDLPLDFLDPSDKPGSIGRLGHYEVQEVVGRGGMGVVLRAFDERLHRVVAIKVMAPQLATSATARRRFTREARAAAAVTHDHVVTIHAVEDAGPLPYIVMQFVAGASLQDRIDRTGPLQLHEVLRIGMQTASGLAAAHAQGLVHRDVKPANILLENGVERVKLTDFGLARAADDASLTQSGAIAGTPQFMSPEQAEGKPVDHRSDLFSLGSVLYAMCAGRPPFRAGTGMGVLKRVCEDTPTPICEANPEVPDWLSEVIGKLHAKAPADRFQSAAEVAEVLGRHLAHVQHPSAVPLPAVAKSAPRLPGPARPASRKRWGVAAAVVLAMFVTLGATEATGVTNVRATVIRIFTPEGTLVVETDDPAVKVIVEGDGDLAITGAGPQEVRLRAGSYRLKATRDGQPVKLDQDLVNITRGDRQIVRVRLEGDPPATVVPKAETGAFVLLAVGRERKFDTLAEAVQSATDGDTIEVRGNGPFACDPVKFTQAVTVRAGEGFRPVFDLTVVPHTRKEPDFYSSLDAVAPLVLEGLEFRLLALDRKPVYQCVVLARSDLRVVNCRFRTANATCLSAHDSPSSNWEVRNCEFLCSGDGGLLVRALSPGQKVILENCVSTRQVSVHGGGPETQKPCVELSRNTFRSEVCAVEFVDESGMLSGAGDGNQRRDGLIIKATGNVFHGTRVLAFTQRAPGSGKILAPGDADRYLVRAIDWKGERNLYSVGGHMAGHYSEEKGFSDSPSLVKKLADWTRFWATPEADSIEGRARYQGGDLLAKLSANPEKLSAEDFRLRPDSAGYRAGKDGKDLGVDVELVGPGPAYERWKKTPAYQQWLKSSGQRGAADPKSEPGAFVLLAVGKERKFDTLAEAVLAASGGDTIEVRGNGPFVSEGVTIRHPLVIRAGTGFAPSITLSKASADRNIPLFAALDVAVLEGLELRRMGGTDKIVENRFPRLLIAREPGALYVANCRLLSKAEPNHCALIDSKSKTLFVRNSVLTTNVGIGTSWFPQSGGRFSVENCVSANGSIAVSYADRDVRDLSVRVLGNTLVGNALNLTLWTNPNLPATGGPPPPFRLELSGNVARWNAHAGFLFFNQAGLKDPLSADQAEAILPRLVGLNETRNAYLRGAPLLRLAADFQPLPSKRGGDRADWDRFWGQKGTGSVDGEVRFHGGDLITRAQSEPEKLTAADFRLRPDSAGYRASEDGKDLGADIDLVGPGAAYERWKTTPAYQQWLKESGQVKK